MKVYSTKHLLHSQRPSTSEVRVCARVKRRSHAAETATRVSNLRGVFRECERVRASEQAKSKSSVLNEFSSSPRARLVRLVRVCLSYVCASACVSMCTYVCMRARMQVRRTNVSDEGLLTSNRRRLFAVISLLNKSLFIREISIRLFATRVFHSWYFALSSGVDIKGEVPSRRGYFGLRNKLEESNTTRAQTTEIYFARLSRWWISRIKPYISSSRALCNM